MSDEEDRRDRFRREYSPPRRDVPPPRRPRSRSRERDDFRGGQGFQRRDDRGFDRGGDRFRRDDRRFDDRRRSFDGYGDRDRPPHDFGGRGGRGGYGRGGGRGGYGGGHRDSRDNLPMSYKQFMSSLPDDNVTPEEGSRRYQEYLKEHHAKQEQQFVDSHKDEDWFLEKFDPIVRGKYAEQLTAETLKRAHEYFADRAAGKIEAVSYDSTTPAAVEKEKDGDEDAHDEEGEEDGEHGGKDEGKMEGVTATTADDGDMNTLFIKSVSHHTSRVELQELLQSVPGFAKLVLSGPMKNRGFHRVGWVTYDSPEACMKALRGLDGRKMKDMTLGLSVNKSLAHKYNSRTAPAFFATDDRIAHDAVKARELARKLDQEAGITQNALLDEPTGQNLRRELDAVLNYMRRVHLCCYYCKGDQCDDEEELKRRCGVTHCRGAPTPAAPAPPKPAAPETPAEEGEKMEVTATTDEVPEGARRLAREIDEKVQARINGTAVKVLTVISDIMLEDARDKIAEKHYVQERTPDDKTGFRCKADNECTKSFTEAKFVKKHLQNKHPSLINEAAEKLARYNVMLGNFRCQPDSIKMPLVSSLNQASSYAGTPRNDRGPPRNDRSGGPGDRDRGDRGDRRGPPRGDYGAPRSAPPPRPTPPRADRGGQRLSFPAPFEYVDLDAPPSGDIFAFRG